MNLQELVKKLAKKHLATDEIIERQLADMFMMMCDALDAGEKVTFHGFGGYGIEVIVHSDKP